MTNRPRPWRSSWPGARAPRRCWASGASWPTPRQGWSDRTWHHNRLLNLLGLDATADPASLSGGADASRWLIEWREMRRPTRPFERPPADPEGEAEAAAMVAELSAFLAARVAEVEAYIATRFPPGQAEAEAEAEAALASAAAALDDSDEGRVLLRYEGQHGREFRATLNQLVKLTQTGIDLVEDDDPEGESDAQIVEIKELASSESESPAEVAAPAPAAPNKPTEAVPGGPPAPNRPAEAAPMAPSAVPDRPERARSPRSNR